MRENGRARKRESVCLELQWVNVFLSPTFHNKMLFTAKCSINSLFVCLQLQLTYDLTLVSGVLQSD